MTIDEIKEKRENALGVMNRIHDENDSGELSGEAQNKWDEAKAEFEKFDAILEREETLEQTRARNSKSVRNMDDGEAKELENFSFAEAINYAVNPQSLSEDKRAFYSEMNQEAENEARNSGVTLQGGQGIAIPSKVMNATTAGSEYDDIGFDERGGFVEFLNNKSVLAQMGAQYMRGLTGNLRFPRESQVPTAVWEGENDANAEGTSAFDSVTMSPKRLGTFVEVSQQLTKQTSPDVEQRIKNQLYGSLQRGIEKAAIAGGATNAPSGIMDIATDANVSGTLHEQIVALETAVANQNADIGTLGYIMNSKTRGVLKTAKKDSGSGRFVFEGNDLNGYSVGVTNHLVEETGTAPLNSPMVFGNFNDLVIGMWGGLELIVDPYSSAKNGLIVLVANQYTDVGVLHNESFSYANIETTSA